MPTFEYQDPLTAASNTVGEFEQNQNEKKKQALADARQKMLDDRQKTQDDRAQANADRDYGLNKTRTDEDVKNIDSDIATRKANLAIAQAREAAQAQLDPINLKIKKGELTAQQAKAAFDKINNGYTLKVNKIAADNAVPMAQLTIQNLQSEIGEHNAGTARENAETAGIVQTNSRRSRGQDEYGNPTGAKLNPGDEKKATLIERRLDFVDGENEKVIASIMKAHQYDENYTREQAVDEAQKSHMLKDTSGLESQLDKLYGVSDGTTSSSNTNTSGNDTNNPGNVDVKSAASKLQSIIDSGQGTYDQAVNSAMQNNSPTDAKKIVSLLKRGKPNGPIGLVGKDAPKHDTLSIPPMTKDENGNWLPPGATAPGDYKPAPPIQVPQGAEQALAKARTLPPAQRAAFIGQQPKEIQSVLWQYFPQGR